MYIKLVFYSWPTAHHRDQNLLLYTMFCLQKRDGFNETQKSLVDVALSVSLSPTHSVAVHIAPVLCKPSYCCHQPPLHPHFHLYPIFHFISILIWEDKKIPCYVIYSDAASYTIQGENHWGWPRGTASPSSKLPLSNQSLGIWMAALFGILMMKMSIMNLSLCKTQYWVENQTKLNSTFLFSFSELCSTFSAGVSWFCNPVLYCFHKGAGLILSDSCL